jgi:Spy/CpxP family protein refolding chaperone
MVYQGMDPAAIPIIMAAHPCTTPAATAAAATETPPIPSAPKPKSQHKHRKKKKLEKHDQEERRSFGNMMIINESGDAAAMWAS